MWVRRWRPAIAGATVRRCGRDAHDNLATIAVADQDDGLVAQAEAVEDAEQVAHHVQHRVAGRRLLAAAVAALVGDLAPVEAVDQQTHTTAELSRNIQEAARGTGVSVSFSIARHQACSWFIGAT